GAAGLRAAHPLPRGDRRGRVRPPGGRRSRRLPRRHLPGAADAVPAPEAATIRPVGRGSQTAQLLALVPLRTLVALRWLTALATMNTAVHLITPLPWLRPVPWWWLLAGWLLTVSPLGRMGVSALGARLLLAGVGPGT